MTVIACASVYAVGCVARTAYTWRTRLRQRHVRRWWCRRRGGLCFFFAWKRHLPVLHGITHSALSLPSSLGEYVLAGPGPLLPAGHCPGLPYVIPDYSVRDSANGSLGSDMTAADVRSTELICMLAAREGEGSEGET